MRRYWRPQGENPLEAALASELKRECSAIADTRPGLRINAEDSSQASGAGPSGVAASGQAGENVGSRAWLMEWKRSSFAVQARRSEAQRRGKILLTEGCRPLIWLCIVKVAVLVISMIGSPFLQIYSYGNAVIIACTVTFMSAINSNILMTLATLRQKAVTQLAESKRSRRPGRPPGVAPKGKAKAKPKAKAADKPKIGDLSNKPKEESSIFNFSPSVKVRQVFWNPIRLKDAQVQPDSIWSQIGQDVQQDKDSYNDVVDASSLEVAFSNKEPIRISIAEKLLPPAQKKTKVLSDARRKQIGVMFKTLPNPEELFLALLNMNQPPADKLSSDQVERLLLNMPSPSEAQALLQTDDDADLDPAENLLKALVLDMQHLKLRLQVMHHENTLRDHMQAIESEHKALSLSMSFLKSSKAIRNLLTAALFTGNFLNSGTERGRADGFAIESLTQLKDVKMNDRLGTLINYITDQMERKHPGELTEIFSVLDEDCQSQVDFIKQASRCNSAEVINQVTRLSSQTNYLLEALKQHCGDRAKKKVTELSDACSDSNSMEEFQDERKRFLPHRDRFLGYVEELGKLNELAHAAHNEFNMLCDWFHVDKTCGARTSDWFFDIWDQFLGDVRKALREHEVREKLKSDAQQRLERRNSLGKTGSTPRGGPNMPPTGEIADKRGMPLHSRFRHSWPKKILESGGNSARTHSGRRDGSLSRIREYKDKYKRSNSISGTGGITPRMLQNVHQNFAQTFPVSTPSTPR